MPDKDVDMVNEPPHYKQGPIEVIEIIEGFKLNYRLGNSIKYILRADHKGHRTEDLKKAVWYLQREIEKTEGTGRDDLRYVDKDAWGKT